MDITRRDFVRATGLLGGTLFLSKMEFARALVERAGPLNLTGDSGSQLIPTTCWIGKQDCGMLARVVNGRLVKLEGNPEHPRNNGRLCPKGQAQIMAVYDPYRLKAPLKRLNEKGVPGEWKEISWDEALTATAEEIKKVMAENPKRILWQKGRSKAEVLYDNSFPAALGGAVIMGHGAYCSDAGYRANEYTTGFKGVFHSDFKYTNYLLNFGWNITNAGGNQLCWITWNQQFIEARERGMKVVTIDPRRRGAGPHTDKWLPIKPGTDLAFFLAIANVLLDKGYIDEPYLKNYTNAPFLVKEDGLFLRVDGKEHVWDSSTASTVPYDKAKSPALIGEYAVEIEDKDKKVKQKIKVKPAFQLHKEHIAQYTPEWASSITGLPAESIREVAMELGENARIGSTTVIDGVELPYRPVCITGYHVSQQELGFQAVRAATMVFMLLGAIEAVGGVRSAFGRGVDKAFKSYDDIKVNKPPYDYTLSNSKFFPINSKLPTTAALTWLNPEKYEVDPNTIPKIMILHMANPLLSFPPQDVFMEAYKKLDFVVAISPWMNETADYFADIVLPAATIEKYEGPMNATDQYVDANALRVPPISPLYQSRNEIDIYIDLCEKAGVLYGKKGYIDLVNQNLKLKDEYALPLDKKPDVRDIFDRWAKSNGIKEGVAFFEDSKNAIANKKPIPVDKLYAPAWNPPYGGIRHRFYGESLLAARNKMKELGASEIFYRQYLAFPTWVPLTMDNSPTEYDLTLISMKKIEFKQSRATFNPLLNELEPTQYVEINPKTARSKGIADNDVVMVTSHNAVTGETKQVKSRAKYVEGIQLNTVAMMHHYGHWSHPIAKNDGPTPNALFFAGEGYVVNTNDQSFQVKVKVEKA